MLDEDETVARLLEELADLEEIDGTDYKPRAYRRAARNIRHHETPLSVLHAEGRIGEVEGVGDAIETKIEQALETGSIEELDEIRERVPIDVRTLGLIRGLGSRKLAKLHDELGIGTLDDLEQAVERDEIQQVAGFGAKTQAKIGDQIERVRRASSRWPYAGLLDTAEDLVERLEDRSVVDEAAIAGGLRRRLPLVEAITLVAGSEDPEATLDAFTTMADTATVEARSARRATIELARGLPVELVVADPAAFGAARIAHTGSADHVQRLREAAAEADLVLAETGLRDADEPRDARTEADFYEGLDLQPVPPELREATGEVQAARDDALPDLVELADVRGDLQMHTTYSDGKRSVEAMARKADELGYGYILLTDHGPSLTVADAPTLEELDEQAEEVARVNAMDDVQARVLHGVEANITADGMDVPEDVARELDLVVASLHDRVDDATERVLEAIENHTVDVFGHPTNRRLAEREGNDLAVDRIVEAARAHDVAIEINAQTNRLDLAWSQVRRFRGEVDFVISTDAHSPAGMEQMRYGVDQARKGWLEPEHVANTRPVDELLERLGRGAL
jgi:DNA polymerase (family 10)